MTRRPPRPSAQRAAAARRRSWRCPPKRAAWPRRQPPHRVSVSGTSLSGLRPEYRLSTDICVCPCRSSRVTVGSPWAGRQAVLARTYRPDSGVRTEYRWTPRTGPPRRALTNRITFRSAAFRLRWTSHGWLQHGARRCPWTCGSGRSSASRSAGTSAATLARRSDAFAACSSISSTAASRRAVTAPISPPRSCRWSARPAVERLPPLHQLEHDLLQAALPAVQRLDLRPQAGQLAGGGACAASSRAGSFSILIRTCSTSRSARVGWLEVAELGLVRPGRLSARGLVQPGQLGHFRQPVPAVVEAGQFGVEVGQFEQAELSPAVTPSRTPTSVRDLMGSSPVKHNAHAGASRTSGIKCATFAGLTKRRWAGSVEVAPSRDIPP